MTSTTIPTPSTYADSRTAAPPLWKAALAAAAVAGVATTLVAAAARAIDVPVAVGGEQIPLAGFAQITVFWVVVGALIGRVLRPRVANPRATFLRVTVALTAVSFLPDVAASATAATKVALVSTHVVAA